MNTIGKQAIRLELAHSQHNADACNAALAAPFHGRTATELRLLYLTRYGTRPRTILRGEDLVQAVKDIYNRTHQ